MTPRVDLAFLTLASVSLLAGSGLGIAMGAVHDFAPAPVHAHVNLVGWASLALFGLAHRAYPDLAGPRTAVAHLMLSGGAGILFPLGLWLEMFHDQPAVIIVAAPLWVLGAGLFATLMVRRSMAAARVADRSRALAEPRGTPADVTSSGGLNDRPGSDEHLDTVKPPSWGTRGA